MSGHLQVLLYTDLAILMFVTIMGSSPRLRGSRFRECPQQCFLLEFNSFSFVMLSFAARSAACIYQAWMRCGEMWSLQLWIQTIQ